MESPPENNRPPMVGNAPARQRLLGSSLLMLRPRLTVVLESTESTTVGSQEKAIGKTD